MESKKITIHIDNRSVIGRVMLVLMLFFTVGIALAAPPIIPGMGGFNPVAASATEAKDSTSMVAKAFALIPDTDLDILTKDMRQEMTIYMEADSTYRIRNIYSGLSWIEEMNEDYMLIRLTDVSSLQIKSLPMKKRGINLIMTIYTIAGEPDTADSTIKFYNLVNPESEEAYLVDLPTKNYFKLPNPKEFYDIKSGELKSVGDKMSMNEIMDEMPFHTIAYTISPTGDDLTARLTISNYLTKELRKRIEPYIREELHWQWDGSKFK